VPLLLCTIENADAAVLVYDITDDDSFNVVKSWYQELTKSVGCLMVIAGNKLDLTENRKVDKTKVEQYAQEKDIPVVEVSSKDSSNIQDLFRRLGNMLIEKYPE